MKLYLDCVPCFFRQALEASRMVTDQEAVHRAVLEAVAREVSSLPPDVTPPEMGRRIHATIRHITRCRDPYRQIKARYNRVARGLYPELTERVRKSSQPLMTAVRLAIAGNVIDCGVSTSFDVHRDLETILHQDFAVCDFDDFTRRLHAARRILYLGDNSSEVVFDRVLVEQLGIPTIYAVRDIPVLNDATMDDARFAGIDHAATVISSGCDAPATLLHHANAEFLEHFRHADVIISKGQGNYEGLSDVDRPVFFLLKAKCSVIAQDLGCPTGSIILQGPRSRKESKHPVHPFRPRTQPDPDSSVLSSSAGS